MKFYELRQKFLGFFEKRGHKIVSSSSLIPNDKTVLLTSAGMQQFIPYFKGEKNVLKDFGTRHLCSIQKCFRTPDIDEVGDDTHHTFFEMLGNWSIGEDKEEGYFKKGAIKMALEFFTEELGLDINRFWITIFKGEKGIPRDNESFQIWKDFGIPAERIVEFGTEDNFWGPVTETGPCGPCSEIHYDRGEKYGCGHSDCGPNCPRCKRFLELWNLVFMEYDKELDDSGGYKYKNLPQRNIDTGIGFERLLAVLEEKESVYETDLFLPIINKLKDISGKKYIENKRSFRIIADHIRGAVFLIADGVFPSNIDRGYILRRVLRRAMRYGRKLNLPTNFLIPLAEEVAGIYRDFYPEIIVNYDKVLDVIKEEEEKFNKTLSLGLKKLNKFLGQKRRIGGEEAFYLYETYGFPFELTQEIAREKGIEASKEDFQKAFAEHQKISRAGAEKKFGGVGDRDNYESVKLHTATHLLHAALRNVLGDEVRQMGSDITPKRLRFDFSYPRKLKKEETEEIENIVNQKIKDGIDIRKEEMG
ncbi:MAG TPA: alanine--tRNA ligase, partial [Candidatus Parcubacteria bacterium]|nr:alanine--tRNA ligase [Candidatus Parcubacteria bacterium]